MNSTPKRPAHRPSKGERAKHTLRLPVELDQALRQRAERHGRCLNDELVHILSAVLSSTPERAVDAYVSNTPAAWVPRKDLEGLKDPRVVGCVSFLDTEPRADLVAVYTASSATNPEN